MTIDAQMLRSEVLDEFGRGLTVTPYGSGFLIITPFCFDDGENVVLAVDEVARDSFVISDRGQAASRLADHGVLLDKAPGTSWDAIRRASTAPLAVGTNEYEIAGSATSSDIGRVVLALAQDSLQAEALKALSPAFRATSLGDRVIRSAHRYDLAIQPRARLNMRNGGKREVTCRIDVDAGVYVQAVSGKQKNSAYDHIRAVFGDAEPADWELTAVLANGLRLDRWQLETLRDLTNTVIKEDEQDDYFRSLSGGEPMPTRQFNEVPLLAPDAVLPESRLEERPR